MAWGNVRPWLLFAYNVVPAAFQAIVSMVGFTGLACWLALQACSRLLPTWDVDTQHEEEKHSHGGIEVSGSMMASSRIFSTPDCVKIGGMAYLSSGVDSKVSVIVIATPLIVPLFSCIFFPIAGCGLT